MSKLNQQISKNVRNWAKLYGFSLASLASYLDLNKSTFYDSLNDYRYWRLIDVYLLSLLFGVRMHRFYENDALFVPPASLVKTNENKGWRELVAVKEIRVNRDHDILKKAERKSVESYKTYIPDPVRYYSLGTYLIPANVVPEIHINRNLESVWLGIEDPMMHRDMLKLVLTPQHEM